MQIGDVTDTNEVENTIEELRETLSVGGEDPDLRDDLEYELETLLAVREEFISQIGEEDWVLGTPLYADHVFIDHARELAEDINPDTVDEWPYTHIDWDAAADDLKNDYEEFIIDGVPYWGRA